MSVHDYQSIIFHNKPVKRLGICPCCGDKVKVKIVIGKWQGQKDQVIIEHEKWR